MENGQYIHYWGLFTANVRPPSNSRARLLATVRVRPHMPRRSDERWRLILPWPHSPPQVALATTSLIAFAWTDYYVEQKALARVEPEKPSVKR